MGFWRGFIQRDYAPGKNDVLAAYYVEPARSSFEFVAEQIAAESSIGTWTDVSTVKPRILKTLKPAIYGLDKKRKLVRIAYPAELFEPGNLPQIMSSLCGNVFGISWAKNLRLLDVSFPPKLVKSFPGPLAGTHGIRKLLHVKKRPFLGSIVKPKLGLHEREHARVAYDAWLGGCDFVKDDENLSSMSFNHFRKRVDATLKMRERAEKETGERKMYLANVTAETMEMLGRAAYVKERGGEYVMVDILTTGFGAVQSLRASTSKLLLHGHRAMHATFTRNKKHGIHMRVIAKFSRLAGIDQLHVGAHVGKMRHDKREVQLVVDALQRQQVQGSSGAREPHRMHSLDAEATLPMDWDFLKPVLGICSGGLHPAKIPALVKDLGSDIACQFGGGIHGHPRGTVAGAKAARQALDAALEGIPLSAYAKTHKELAEALKKWGRA